jgi:uncharacterized membrane protein
METRQEMHGMDLDTTLRRRAERTLQAGFLVAVVLIGIGVVLAAVQREAFPDTVGTPLDVLQGTLDGEPASVIGLGILGMILTPFATAGVVAWSFFEGGDRRYAAISGMVLGILLVSALVAFL